MLLLKILLITLLILFPFGEILRFDIGNNIFLKPLDGIALLLLIWIIILYIKNKSWRNSLKWNFFLFPVVGFVSLVINSFWLKPHEFITSFLYLLRWVSYMSIFFAIIQMDEKFRGKIIKFLFIDGLTILLIGYFQYFLYPNLRNLYYLGWDEHLYRMFSSFLDPNFTGAFFVLYFIFICGFIFNKTKNIRKRKIFYASSAILTLFAIFLTYSRSSLLMLLASGVTFFLLLQKRKFIFYLTGAMVIFIIIISPFFYIENLNLFRINSSIERLQTAQNAIKIGMDHPLIGVGFDTYRYAQISYHFIKSTSQFPSNSAAGADTSLLFVFATTGTIGLFAYGYLWYSLGKIALKAYKKNIFAAVFFASAVGLVVNSLFINSLFYSEIMLWVWVIAGLMINT